MAQVVSAQQSPYVWEGTDKRGKRIKGKMLAVSEAAVRADLRRQGVVARKVRKEVQLFKGGKKITSEDIALFARQLATMLQAGIPMVQCFDIIGNGHDKPAMQKLVLSIKADIEAGTTLHEALGKHPLYFDDLFVNLVEAGEQAGALETLLDKIATYKEKTEALKKKIKKALFYPAAVLVVAVIVTIILLVFVIPQFESLFEGFGADLPTFTQMVIDLSKFVQAQGWWMALIAGSAGYAFFYIKKRSKALRRALDRMTLKMPVIGPIMVKAAIARYARTLSTMFAAGVPLVQALPAVGRAAGNAVYLQATARVRHALADGASLTTAMARARVFPAMLLQMCAIGEGSGTMDDMLAKAADFHEAEADALVAGLSSLMEPFIIAFLGLVVGGIVIAMYLPIFQMGQAI